jgi:hypothetical protein
MVVPADPASCLVLIQATMPLGRLSVLLDSPACGAYLRHFVQWHLRRSVRPVILQLWLLTQRASRQQSFSRTGTPFLAEPCPYLRVLVD